MGQASGVNDFVIRFANVNGSGSASANDMFAKAIFRMGIPVSPKNIFPSNIQGLPTWYEVRVNDKGYLGRREGVDIIVSVNPQSFDKDTEIVKQGGYFIYDNSKPLHDQYRREDINYIGIPMIKLAMEHYTNPRQQQLFKNIIYVGALSELLGIEMEVIKGIIAEQFQKKPKLIPPNELALDLGANYARENYDCPLEFRLERSNGVGDSILIDGNTAGGIGAVFGGATVASWYPITPSTSFVGAFEEFANKLRVDKDTDRKNFAIIQAEDELAAVGMVLGATWNGARAFTATSGPGVSLMSEFLGLAYFAEIPVTLVNVQRAGPSTGMPTRTQQADILSSAYASHGDTRHILLFPNTPEECFRFTAQALDLADRFQTPVILMTDLDLGMNKHVSPPLDFSEDQKYDIGKVLDAEALENTEEYGRYVDVDDDGICYRTLPGTHPTKGAFFTRGTARDEMARYTEDGAAYKRVVDRLMKKWETAKSYVPEPELFQEGNKNDNGVIFFGTTTYAAMEASEMMKEVGIELDMMRIAAFPFNETVDEFIKSHDKVFVVEQNRDAQFRSLLINELEINPNKLIPILNYDGMPITADKIKQLIEESEVFAQETQN